MSAEAQKESRPTADATNRKILLVEDDVDTRRTLDDLLSDEGYEVECAASGREALQWLDGSRVKPALILLDLWMPYMDGLQFRATQRSLPALQDIPVLVITAGGVSKDEATLLGLHHILMKPLDERRVLNAVRKFLPDPARR
jgi:CheY-like chemotaxis protein